MDTISLVVGIIIGVALSALLPEIPQRLNQAIRKEKEDGTKKSNPPQQDRAVWLNEEGYRNNQR